MKQEVKKPLRRKRSRGSKVKNVEETGVERTGSCSNLPQTKGIMVCEENGSVGALEKRELMQ